MRACAVVAVSRSEIGLWSVPLGSARGECVERVAVNGNAIEDAVLLLLERSGLPHGTPVTFALLPPVGWRKQLRGVPASASSDVATGALNTGWERFCALPREAVELGALHRTEGGWQVDLFPVNFIARAAEATRMSQCEFRGASVVEGREITEVEAAALANLPANAVALTNPERDRREGRRVTRRRSALLVLVCATISAHLLLPHVATLKSAADVPAISSVERLASERALVALESIEGVNSELRRIGEFRRSARCLSCFLADLAGALPSGAFVHSMQANETDVVLVLKGEAGSTLMASLSDVPEIAQVLPVGAATRVEGGDTPQVQATVRLTWRTATRTGASRAPESK